MMASATASTPLGAHGGEVARRIVRITAGGSPYVSSARA